MHEGKKGDLTCTFMQLLDEYFNDNLKFDVTNSI
jgi:hypothetical protein